LNPHEFLRKVYAQGAFTLLGFLFKKSAIPGLRGNAAAAIAIGAYSAAIKLGQIVIDHTHETLPEHGFDIASGAVGGLIGAWAVQLMVRPRLPLRQSLAKIALAVVLLALICVAYARTYGAS
jgi:hypothetical protein